MTNRNVMKSLCECMPTLTTPDCTFFSVGQQFPAKVFSKRTTHVRYFLLSFGCRYYFFFFLWKPLPKVILLNGSNFTRDGGDKFDLSAFSTVAKPHTHTRRPKTCSCKILTHGFFGSCAAGRVHTTRPSQNGLLYFRKFSSITTRWALSFVSLFSYC